MKPSVRYYFLIFMFGVLGASGAAHASMMNMYQPPVDLDPDFAARFDQVETSQQGWVLPGMTLTDDKGHTLLLNQMTGRWRLLNFWASWCALCVDEIESLRTLGRLKEHKNFEVVFISLDRSTGAGALPYKFKETEDLPSDFHTYYSDDVAIWDKVGIPAIPVSIIIDPAGLAHFQFVGAIDWVDEDSLAFIDQLLNNEEKAFKR